MSNQLIPYRATKGDILASVVYAMSDPKARKFLSDSVSAAKGMLFPKAPTLGPQQIHLSVKPKSKNRRRNKSKRKTLTQTLIRNPAQTTITISVDVVTAITTSGTSGVRTYAAFLGYKNTNFDWDFSSSSQLTNLANSFQFSTLLAAEFKWIPTVAYSTTGVIGLAISPESTVTGGPTSMQYVLQKDISIMSDVKETCAIRYRAVNEEDLEAKANKDSSSVAAADRRFYAANLLWVRFETNVTTDTTSVGFVAQTYTIRFERLW